MNWIQQQQLDRMIAERMMPEVNDALRFEIGTRLAGTSWVLIETGDDGQAWQHQGLGLRVMWSVAREDDDRPWLHVSVSHRNGWPPNRNHMARVKEVFVGPDRYAYEVWPPADRYVNIGEVLHLWAPVDHQPLPEFSHVLPDGRRTV